MNQPNDVQSFRRLLGEIADMCEHASLTGSLAGGETRTLHRYNSVLEKLVRGGDVPEGLFTALPEGATFGDIGVEARMLASYFQDDRKKRRHDHDEVGRSVLVRLAPFVRQEELGMLVREQRRNGTPIDMETLTHLAPFLGQDILSELLREQLSQRTTATSNERPATTSSLEPNPAPATPNYTLAQAEVPKETLSDLLDMLKSPYLSEQERLNLIERVRAASTP